MGSLFSCTRVPQVSEDLPGNHLKSLGVSKCVICHQGYNKTNRAPITVSCGHTFCYRCVVKTYNWSNFKCHTCRAMNSFSSNGVCKNLALIEMLENNNLLANDDVSLRSLTKTSRL